MHLNSSLAVANIMWFLFSSIVYKREESRKIIVSHMLESKFPKLFIFIGIVFGVIA